MKSNKFILILTSIVCLLPVILALAMYDDLPESVAMQWNLKGEPNWYAPKAIAAFGMPVFFAAINIAVLAFLFNDPKRKNIADKLLAIVQWIIPLASLITVPLILLTAMGIALPVVIIAFTFAGFILILIGNYLPKSKQNYSVGIKIPWTLNDSENWNRTHRLTGYLFTISGFLFIIFGFLSLESFLALVLFLVLIALLVIVPILYSYSLYKRKKGIRS